MSVAKKMTFYTISAFNGARDVCHKSDMRNIKAIQRSLGTPSPAPYEVKAPVERAHIPGVLIIVGQGLRFGVTRWHDSLKKRRDVKVGSVVEAFRQLLIQHFDIIIVMPGVIAANDDESLGVLRDLANRSPVLVLSETTSLMANTAHFSEPERYLPTADQLNNDLAWHEAVSVGPLMGYRTSGMITMNGEPLKLSITQSRILWRLLDAPQHQCKAVDLVAAMDNPGFKHAMETLRVHITRLRQRLAAAGGGGMLVTGRGIYWLHWPPANTNPHG